MDDCQHEFGFTPIQVNKKKGTALMECLVCDYQKIINVTPAEADEFWFLVS